MSIVASLLSVFGAVRRLFAASPVEVTSAVAPIPVIVAARAPAVAGYVRRLVVDRFFLASRLASVARLNTPQGRIPRTERRPSARPSIPSDRIGAKKVRSGTSQGLRVLPLIEAKRRSAEIIPFPQARVASRTAVRGMKKAA